VGYTETTLLTGVFSMKQIISITAVLAVITVAIVGCLYIFEVLSYDRSVSILLKAVAAIVLLGGCSALITFLMGSKKEPPA
jgi:type IV secretory pathway VirB2 component (pilin)